MDTLPDLRGRKNAKIYLLDEPASGLDPLSSNELSILLKKLASNGAAILMASHDLFRVRETCDKIGILKATFKALNYKESEILAIEQIQRDTLKYSK